MRDNLDELKKATYVQDSEESIDNRSVVFSIHVTSSQESDCTSSLVTSYEEEEEEEVLEISEDSYQDNQEYAHLSPLSQLIELASAPQNANFDILSTITKTQLISSEDYPETASCDTFTNDSCSRNQ